MRKDGGSAFPIVGISENQSTGEVTCHETSAPGMSLRDYFAAKAMQGCLAMWPAKAGELPKVDGIAEAAFAYADAMLKAREQS
jgi:hypothetical protein